MDLNLSRPHAHKVMMKTSGDPGQKLVGASRVFPSTGWKHLHLAGENHLDTAKMQVPEVK